MFDSLPVTLNAYDGYDYRKKVAKKLYGATYGNVVSVLSVHHQASVTVAEVEDAEESGDTAYAVTHGESPCRLIVDSRHTPDQNYRGWGSATPVT